MLANSNICGGPGGKYLTEALTLLTGFLLTTSGLLTTATREMMVRAELST